MRRQKITPKTIDDDCAPGRCRKGGGEAPLDYIRTLLHECFHRSLIFRHSINAYKNFAPRLDSHLRRLRHRRLRSLRRLILRQERLEPLVPIVRTLLQLLSVSLHSTKVEAQTASLAGDVGAEDPVVLHPH